MKQDIFDGGGSFESAFWTGEPAYASPRNTSEQKMEIKEEPSKKQKKEDKKTELKNEEYLTS